VVRDTVVVIASLPENSDAAEATGQPTTRHASPRGQRHPRAVLAIRALIAARASA